ncbi:hypothetical protein GCM10027452_20880 [Micromonospora halotolerans]
MHDLLDGADHYVQHLVGTVPHRLDGIKVVVDCANGAAADVAPVAYREAGAEVIAIYAEPDGLNINDECGSNHIEALRAAVVEHGAHLGIAHDGDADRCVAVTADGDEVDGDQVMAILALAMREAGELTQDTLVATVMSNLGLRLAMSAQGIRLVETKVGDRYVLEELRASGLALGGEQSGHIVMPAYATTGDGVLTGLHLMSRMAATGKSLADLAGVVTKLPQVLINVPVGDRTVGAAAPAACAEAVTAVRAADWLIFGPGSWYTSVLPHLLVPGLADAIVSSPARRLVTLNLVAEKETLGLSLPDHLDTLRRYLPELKVDMVLADSTAVGDPVAVERAAESLGARLVLAPVAVTDGTPRHDPAALGAALVPVLGADR